MTSHRPLFCITGTTGSGKNSIGVRLAEKLAAEIVSLDSMKIYRGMDLGTAKPSSEQLARVKHHLIDSHHPHECIDLRRYLDEADAIIAARHQAGVPIVCVGGTAMYLTGLLFGVHDGPSRDLDFRRQLRAEKEALGIDVLYDRLKILDPASADRINANDFRRIERALEIHATTGQLASELENNWFQKPRYDAHVVVVTWPRDILRARIDDRVNATFNAGWIDEVMAIEAKGGFSDEAIMALGYREIREHLNEGGDEEALRSRIKTKTWQFARRQLTWMKRYDFAEKIVCSAKDDTESIAQRLCETFGPIWQQSQDD